MKTPSLMRREDIVCYSHLRWGFVFQRPQHLLGRFAKHRRTFFIEEPLYEDAQAPSARIRACEKTGVIVMTPVLPAGMGRAESVRVVSRLVQHLFKRRRIEDYIAWYYTPMALDYAVKKPPRLVVYDCMDELSLFRHAPPDICEKERRLFKSCHLVFTGGLSLFEEKQKHHPNVWALPSSVDVEHFAKARLLGDCRDDQKNIARPRIGYAGVVDERIDLELIAEIARQRPDWQIVMIGPVVKIDPATLPKAANIHWLGKKDYDDLPAYFASWDVAMMPFALNDSTRFISPTKTPEYLAAGLPVISTPIRDVMRQYGRLGLVDIVHSPEEFLRAAERAMTYCMGLKWRERVDDYLRTMSWDHTWRAMDGLIEKALELMTVEKPGPTSVISTAEKALGA